MGRSRVRIKRDKNRIPEVARRCDQLNGATIRVGVLQEGEIKMIAIVQEFGIKIFITPKMRRWLHANGFHVRDTLTHITIPERSFIRAGWDANEREILDNAVQYLEEAIDGGISAEAVFEGIGLETQSAIRDFARDLKNPANHWFTKFRKGSSNPLVDTGNLIQSIDYEVRQ